MGSILSNDNVQYNIFIILVGCNEMVITQIRIDGIHSVVNIGFDCVGRIVRGDGRGARDSRSVHDQCSI